MYDTPEANATRNETVAIQGHGHALAGTLFKPVSTPKAWVVLAGATGVPHRYYRHFARWLSEEFSLAVLTFDYRDFGGSRTGSMRKSTVTMSDWGTHDVAAALAWTKVRAGGSELWVIGHSLGGMLLPMVPGIQSVNRIICVASGPVHWTDHPWPFRALALSFWYAHGPLSVAALGYLSGRLSALGSDLPAGVYWQWRRWCTTKGSFLNDLGRALPDPDMTLKPQVRLVAISDDTSIPTVAVRRLMQSYPQAQKTLFKLRPQDYGLNAIGHIKAFSKECSAVWPAIVA